MKNIIFLSFLFVLMPFLTQAQIKKATSTKAKVTIKQSANPLTTKFYTQKELEDIKIKSPEKNKLIKDFEKAYGLLKTKTKKLHTKGYLWYWYSKDKKAYEILIEKTE